MVQLHDLPISVSETYMESYFIFEIWYDLHMIVGLTTAQMYINIRWLAPDAWHHATMHLVSNDFCKSRMI